MERQPRQSLPISDLIVLFEHNQLDMVTFTLDISDFIELINFYEEEKKYVSALEVTAIAITNYKYHSDFYILKAKLLLYSENYTEAFQAIEYARKLSSNNLEISLIKVQVLSLLKEFDSAISLVNELASKVTKEELSLVYLTESYIYENMSDNEAMYNILYKAAVLDPLNEDILNRLWNSIQSSRFYYKGIKLYKRLIDIQPFSYLAWYHLGNAYIYVGEYEQAIDAMEYSFLIKDDFEEGYLEFAELCIQEGHFKKALESYLDVLALSDEDSELLTNIGNCYYLLGEFDNAQRYFEEAVEIDSFNDQIYYLRAKSFIANNQPENAIEALYHAIEIDDQVEEYYYFLAKAYRLKGDVANALKNYKRATRICPEQSFFWKKYIAYLMDLKLYSKVLVAIDKSTNYTYDVELHYYKAVVYMMLNDRKQGIVILEEALKEDFSKHELIYHFNNSLRVDKDIKALIRYYYRELNPIFK